MSIVANPSEKIPTLDDSRTITAPELSDNSTTATVHTDNEHPILEVPISDDPLNKFTKQIVLNIVGDIKGRSIVTKTFDTHTRITVQLSESNLEQDVTNAIKEYVKPKIKTGLLINPQLAMYSIIPIIQKHLKAQQCN